MLCVCLCFRMWRWRQPKCSTTKNIIFTLKWTVFIYFSLQDLKFINETKKDVCFFDIILAYFAKESFDLSRDSSAQFLCEKCIKRTHTFSFPPQRWKCVWNHNHFATYKSFCIHKFNRNLCVFVLGQWIFYGGNLCGD